MSSPETEIPAITSDNWLDGLDDREQIFVLEYLKDLRPERAALSAGYAPSMARTKAYQWVSDGQHKPDVYAAIQFALNLRKNQLQVTAEMVVAELKRIAFADPRKAIRWHGQHVTEEDNPDGGDVLVIKRTVNNLVELVPSDELDDDTAMAIAEVSQNTTGGVKIKFHDKRAALTDLGKHLGIMDERVRHLGPNGGPVQMVHGEMTPKEAADAYQATLAED